MEPFPSVIHRLTIFNLEIRSANAANLIPTSRPSVIPPTLSAFGQIRFRRHGQFLYANLLITQRKHIGRVRCSRCRVYSRVSLAVLLSSALPALLFALRNADRRAPLRRWKSQKIPRPRQNYDRVCIEKETVAVELLQSIFPRERHADRTFFFFQSRAICYQFYLPCTKISERVGSIE